MPKYRLKTGSHTMHNPLPDGKGDAQVFTAGERGKDILDLTKEQAERFDAGRLEPLSTGEAREEAKEETPNTVNTGATKTVTDNTDDRRSAPAPESDWSAVLSQGVNDVRALVVVMEDPKELEALKKEEEKANSPRKMVLDAVDKRLGELKK